MNYKYCIKEKMEKLPYKEFKLIKKQIPAALGKTIRTFERYCNLTCDEFGDIPAQDLDIIASFLNCSPDELKNYCIRDRQIQHKIIRLRR